MRGYNSISFWIGDAIFFLSSSAKYYIKYKSNYVSLNCQQWASSSFLLRFTGAFFGSVKILDHGHEGCDFSVYILAGNLNFPITSFKNTWNFMHKSNLFALLVKERRARLWRTLSFELSNLISLFISDIVERSPVQKRINHFSFNTSYQFSVFVFEIIEGATQGKPFKAILNSGQQLTLLISHFCPIFEKFMSFFYLTYWFSLLIFDSHCFHVPSVNILNKKILRNDSLLFLWLFTLFR